MDAVGVRRVLGPPTTVAANLAEDDRLLAEGVPVVRAAPLSDESLSLGVSQGDGAACAVAARADGIPVVHRSTGGTGVLHLVGDLAWSVVLPRGHPLVGSDFTRAYGRIGAGVSEALRRRDVRAAWTNALSVHPEYCFLGPRGEALSVDGRVLGGAAQRLTARALLHQGVIARRVDPPRLERYFKLPTSTSARYLTGLTECGIDDPPERLAADVVEALARRVEAGGVPRGRA